MNCDPIFHKIEWDSLIGRFNRTSYVMLSGEIQVEMLKVVFNYRCGRFVELPTTDFYVDSPSARKKNSHISFSKHGKLLQEKSHHETNEFQQFAAATNNSNIASTTTRTHSTTSPNSNTATTKSSRKSAHYETHSRHKSSSQWSGTSHHFHTGLGKVPSHRPTRNND